MLSSRREIVLPQLCSHGKKTFTSPSRSGFGKLFLPGQHASPKASFYLPSASRCSNGSLWGVRSCVPRWPLRFQDSAYQDEICINENTGVLIRNALVIKVPPPTLCLVVCLFNRQRGYLPGGSCVALLGPCWTMLAGCTCSWMACLLWIHFLIAHLVCTRGGVMRKWVRGRYCPGDVWKSVMVLRWIDTAKYLVE